MTEGTARRSRRVTDGVPIGVGVAALAWAITLTPGAAAFPVPWLRWCYLGVWVAAGLALLVRRGVPVAGIVLAVLAFHRVFWPDPSATGSPQTLLGWFALIVAVTQGSRGERALLLRVCVSCVYGFTALAKLNPSFLAGEQIVYLAATRDHLEVFQALAASGWGVAAAWGTVLVELWLAVGLWWRRTRRATAILGGAFHLALVLVASGGFAGVVFLGVLNGLVVLGYLAFFERATARR